jgi:hypothetical protein
LRLAISTKPQACQFRFRGGLRLRRAGTMKVNKGDDFVSCH